MRIISLIIIILFVSCKKQSKQDAKDYYNLSFSEQRIWGGGFRWCEQQASDTVTNCFFWSKDSTQPGRIFFRLTETKLAIGKRIPLRSIFSQKIALQIENQKIAEITLRNKGNNLETAWLKVYSLGKQEELLRTDSIDIQSVDWQTHSLPILLQGVYYLRLSIVVAGKDCDNQPGAEMWIDKLTCTIDGKDLQETNHWDKKENLVLNINKIKSLSMSRDSDFLAIPELQSKFRILGIGETMHGCLTFGKINNQIVRMLLKHKNCKLVMLELPSMLVLKSDLYIQGYPVEFKDIEEDLIGLLNPIEEIKELLDYLRTYNQTAKKKVRIIGFDRNERLYVPLMHDYFYEMYRQMPNKIVREFMRKYNYGYEILKLLNMPKTVDMLGDFEYKWFGAQYGLYFTENNIPEVKKHGALNSRDFIMWKHVQHAILFSKLEENETAVLLAHWKHVNKWDIASQPNHSLGYYLSEAYGDDYRAIGLLGGKGTFNSSRRGRLESECPLPEPEPGSLEAAAMKTGIPYFYYPAKVLPETPIRLRDQPHCYESGQFQDFSIHTRMDGFIFVRDCKGSPFPRSWTGTMDIYTQRTKRILVRENNLKAKGL